MGELNSATMNTTGQKRVTARGDARMRQRSRKRPEACSSSQQPAPSARDVSFPFSCFAILKDKSNGLKYH